MPQKRPEIREEEDKMYNAALPATGSMMALGTAGIGLAAVALGQGLKGIARLGRRTKDEHRP